MAHKAIVTDPQPNLSHAQNRQGRRRAVSNRTVRGRVSRQTSQGASPTQTSSGELSEMAEQIQTLVGQFKV